MTTPRFTMRRTGAIVLCLAAAMFATSCGGNASKKKAANGATETKTETAAPAKGNAVWTSNEYLKLIPKPDFVSNSDEVDVKATSVITYFRESNPTKEQVAAYWEKVKAAGFTLRTMNADDGTSFSASNEAGCRVELDLRSLQIGKQRADGYGIE